MSSGLASTRRFELEQLLQLLLPVFTYGSQVATTPRACSRATGRILKRCGVMARHHVGDCGEVDLQGVDVEILHPRLLREPLGEPLDAHEASAAAWACALSGQAITARDEDRRGACLRSATSFSASALGPGRGDQGLEHLGKGEAVVL